MSQPLSAPLHSATLAEPIAAPSGSLGGVAALAAPLLEAPAALYLAPGAPPLAHWACAGLAWASAPHALLDSLRDAVIRSGEPLAVEDFRLDPRFHSAWCEDRPEVRAFAGVPVRSSARRVVGVLGVVELRPRRWEPDEVGRLAALAPALAAVLERDRLADDNDRLATALVHSDARHRRLVATCPLAIYGLDREGRLTELNQATADILGRPAHELVGMPFLGMVAPEDVEAARLAFAGTVTGRDAPGDLELRVVRPTGEKRLVQITRAPIERDDEIIGVQGIGRDITEERSRESQFRRVERMASVAPLLSGVCHELNNPLTSIKSFADLMLLDDRPDEDREAIEIVAREAQRAAKIVSDLRVVARQSQESSATSGLVELNELVRQTVTSRPELVAGARVRLELTAHLPSAWGVRGQLEQVVYHLLSNAVRAAREASGDEEVLIRTFAGDLGVALEVADHGPGIRTEDHNRIFDPFWTTRAPGEGTGLGLSLVHSIVTDHGGRIRVDSEPGRGATFSVDLPAAEEAPATPEANASSVAARQSLRVLVVDDEAPIRTSLSRYLERRGHEVAVAAEGGAAMDLLQQSTSEPAFDIIVADLRMPGLDGERFVARLRERGDGLEHRLIFITGDAESPDVEPFLREVAAPVVCKPFELAEVAQIIEAQAGMSVP